MLPYFAMLAECVPLRAEEALRGQRASAFRFYCPALQDPGIPPRDRALLAALWAGWRGTFGVVPAGPRGRLCPHACCHSAPLSLPHLIRDCPAAEDARRVLWAALYDVLPRSRAAPAMASVLPRVGHAQRDLVLQLALGLPPTRVAGAPAPDSWHAAAVDPHGRLSPGLSLFAGLFPAFRRARGFARRVRRLTLRALPPGNWPGRPVPGGGVPE